MRQHSTEISPVHKTPVHSCRLPEVQRSERDEYGLQHQPLGKDGSFTTSGMFNHFCFRSDGNIGLTIRNIDLSYGTN